MPEKVTLTDGEVVTVLVEGVCFPKQAFSRVGPNILAGVVNTPAPEEWHGVYFWHDTGDGVYRYLGDMTMREMFEHRAVLIKFNAHVPLRDTLAEQERGDGFSVLARKCLRQSLASIENSMCVPNHAEFLARTNRAAELDRDDPYPL